MNRKLLLIIFAVASTSLLTSCVSHRRVHDTEGGAK